MVPTVILFGFDKDQSTSKNYIYSAASIFEQIRQDEKKQTLVPTVILFRFEKDQGASKIYTSSAASIFEQIRQDEKYKQL